MHRLARVAVALAALACSATTHAHVFWLQPSTFTPGAGENVRLQLRVGDQLPGDPVPRDESRIISFVAQPPGDAAAQRVEGRNGRDPAGSLRPTAAGVWLIGYAGAPNALTLESEKFEHYLKEEGLEAISTRRAERGQSSEPAQERFSRCAKSLLVVAGGSPAGWDRPLGLRCEIVPLDDPSSGGATRRLRVLFDGRPLPGTLVKARRLSDAGEVIHARTNAQGEVAIDVPGSGAWLFSAVHMIEAPADSGAQWDSFWASLTMLVPGARQ